MLDPRVWAFLSSQGGFQLQMRRVQLSEASDAFALPIRRAEACSWGVCELHLMRRRRDFVSKHDGCFARSGKSGTAVHHCWAPHVAFAAAPGIRTGTCCRAGSWQLLFSCCNRPPNAAAAFLMQAMRLPVSQSEAQKLPRFGFGDECNSTMRLQEARSSCVACSLTQCAGGAVLFEFARGDA